VELIVAHPLVLPDTPLALDALEETIHAWGATIMQHAFTAAWEAQAAVRPPVACPACQAADQRRAGRKARHLETRFGPVVVQRQRMRCRSCGRQFQPDDVLLTPALGAGRCTPALRALAAQCGASWPYPQAAAVLGMVRGVPLAAETIRQIVATTGEAVACQYREQGRAVCSPPATTPPSAIGPPRLDVALDGAWVHSRESARGMEIKVGVAHTGSACRSASRAYLPTRRYAATAQGVAVFAPLVTAMIDHLDGFASNGQTLVGDGAEWIWRLGAEILPDARAILDRWHLRDARRRATRAAIPDKAGRAPWSAQLEATLDRGAVDEALVVLAALGTQYPHPAVTEFSGYLRNQRGRIVNYAARRAAGQTIGSGVIEKGADVVVNRRLKGKRGMRWRRDRADEVVALRLARLNDEWEMRLSRHSP
jgi:hypothetical protein